LKNDANVPSKSNRQKTYEKIVFYWRLEGLAGSGSISKRPGSGARSVSKCHGFSGSFRFLNFTEQKKVKRV
jgi:hypothetical protein